MLALLGFLASLGLRRRRAGGHWAWTVIWILATLMKRSAVRDKVVSARYRMRNGDRLEVLAREAGS